MLPLNAVAKKHLTASFVISLRLGFNEGRSATTSLF